MKGYKLMSLLLVAIQRRVVGKWSGLDLLQLFDYSLGLLTIRARILDHELPMLDDSPS